MHQIILLIITVSNIHAPKIYTLNLIRIVTVGTHSLVWYFPSFSLPSSLSLSLFIHKQPTYVLSEAIIILYCIFTYATELRCQSKSLYPSSGSSHNALHALSAQVRYSQSIGNTHLNLPFPQRYGAFPVHDVLLIDHLYTCRDIPQLIKVSIIILYKNGARGFDSSKRRA